MDTVSAGDQPSADIRYAVLQGMTVSELVMDGWMDGLVHYDDNEDEDDDDDDDSTAFFDGDGV